MLLFQLGECTQAMVVRLQRKADEPLPPLRAAKRGDDVGRFDQVQRERLAGLVDLAGGHLHGAIVARGGDADQTVAAIEDFLALAEHFLGRDDLDHAYARRIIDVYRTADDDHVVAGGEGVAARARPMRPLEALVKYRTGSRYCLVGPEVIRMRAIENRNRASLSGDRRDSWRRESAHFCGVRASCSAIAAKIFSGAAIRPMPRCRQLSHPSSGPTRIMPSSRNCVTLRCTADLSHISQFMAGASMIGPVKLKTSVLSKSSASPCAVLARKLAVAGATQRISPRLARSICAPSG